MLLGKSMAVADILSIAKHPMYSHCLLSYLSFRLWFTQGVEIFYFHKSREFQWCFVNYTHTVIIRVVNLHARNPSHDKVAKSQRNWVKLWEYNF